MVIAEVPLWIIHDSNSGTTSTSTTLPNDATTAGSTTSTTTTTGSTIYNSFYYHQRAVSSLDILLPFSSSSSNNNNNNNLIKKKKKCAIYSLDVHPDGTKFATAGGDGTVRIWNTGALFHKHHKTAKYVITNDGSKTTTSTTATPTDSNNTNIANHADANGNATYISTDYSSSSSSSSSGSARDDDDDDNGKKKNKERNGDSMSVSSSVSSSSSSSSDQQQKQKQPVHDLNAVVRKKKDPSTITETTTTTSNISDPTRIVSTTTTTAESGLLSSSKTTPADDAAKDPPTVNDEQAGPKATTTAAAGATTATATTTTTTNNNNDHHHHHRLLCTLSAHTGSSVLIVRFSNNGLYLASAADDACVCIYTPSTSSVGGNLLTTGSAATAANIEHWTRIRLCRGHSLDVVDLAWSPDDTYLVSCSLDSETPIIVWNMRDLQKQQREATATSSTSTGVGSMIMKPYKVLGINIHTSTVKGVAFDPAGTYFASSGDDPAICIWRAYDDWGLEQRIDSKYGIFRTWGSSTSSSGKSAAAAAAAVDNAGELSNQSLFRRISWSTDGSFIGSTNSVVKNKNVLSTISRGDGGGEWKAGPGAANLVGHKQPVVCCRHSSKLLSSNNRTKEKVQGNNEGNNGSSEDDDDNKANNSSSEPDYATLLAMGDRRGFVTVWSTKKSRPIFKLQCSESRCTVTDLSWGTIPGGLFLLVSLLDGQVVALKFAVPDELGSLLTEQEKARVFQLRYGIDITDSDGVYGGWSQKHRFTGRDNKLIENALQMTLEDQIQNDGTEGHGNNNEQHQKQQQMHHLLSIKARQEESRSKDGKKRVRPVLLTQMGVDSNEKRSKQGGVTVEKKQQKTTDPLQHAMEVADRAEATAATSSAVAETNSGRKSITIGEEDDDDDEDEVGAGMVPPRTPQSSRHVSIAIPSATAIPHSTDRVYTADLPVLASYVPGLMMQVDGFDGDKGTVEKSVMVAECKNRLQVPLGSIGSAIPCIDLSIVKSGRIVWKDQIVGATCSALSASKHLLAVGMVDGSIQLYSTCHVTGWAGGNAFRSHPPFIVLNGNPIVSLQLRESQQVNMNKPSQTRLELLVVTADGSFGVYGILPEFLLLYKGSILPAMTHMASSISSSTTEQRLPKLSRIYITETNRLFLLLSLQPNTNGTIFSSPNHVTPASPSRSTPGSVDVAGVGGSLQAFVYDKSSEIWIRVSDSRFLLSDFYNTLPHVSTNTKTGSNENILEQLDDSVRIGSMQSSLKKAAHRGQQQKDRKGSLIYSQQTDEHENGNYVATRSHCEDRMSCALALGSSNEFKYWLNLYVQTLSRAGHGSQLRMLTDMLLGSITDTAPPLLSDALDDAGKDGNRFGCCWWLGMAVGILNMDRKGLVKSIIIPEMSKNRALQRITNEIALELDSIQNKE